MTDTPTTDQPTLAVLKPCPMCGSDNVVRRGQVSGPLAWAERRCSNCNLSVTKSNNVDADTAWNTRTNSEPRSAGDLREAAESCACHLRERAKGFRKAAFDQNKRAGPLASGFETAADEIVAWSATHSPEPMAVGLEDGEWFYPEGDHSSDECRFSVGEVIDDALNGREASRVVCIERAVSLPAVYAAVRVWTDAEKDERESDDDYDYTLFATADEARAALAAHPSTQEGGDRG